MLYLVIVSKQTYKILQKSNSNYLATIAAEDELTQAIILKISLVKWNLIIVILNVFMFIGGNLGLAFAFRKSDTLYSQIYNITLDICILSLVLINLRPRKLLFLFESVNFEFEEYNSILKVNVKKKKIINIYKKLIDKTEIQGTSSQTKVESLVISSSLSKTDKNTMNDHTDSFVIMIVNPVPYQQLIDDVSKMEKKDSSKESKNSLRNTGASSKDDMLVPKNCLRDKLNEDFDNHSEIDKNNNINTTIETDRNSTANKTICEQQNKFSHLILNNFTIGGIVCFDGK